MDDSDSLILLAVLIVVNKTVRGWPVFLNFVDKLGNGYRRNNRPHFLLMLP